MMYSKPLIQVKIWLLENEDYYKEIQPIVQLHCDFCSGENRSVPCIRETYQAEFDFEELYVRTGVLPKYLDTAKEIDGVIEVYNNTNFDDEESFKNWIIYLEDFWAERYLCGDIEEMLVKNEEGKVLGFKVIHSKLFNQNPYYVPINGYENLLVFNEFYKKYLYSETKPKVPYELLRINPAQSN